jgi:hypothetical protein
MTLETKTLQSPLGPPPSVVLMPKHISQQFMTQQQQQRQQYHHQRHSAVAPTSDKQYIVYPQGAHQNKMSIVDQVLQKQNQNRRLKLQHEMGIAMNHLKQKQIRFKKYIDKRTTPPKIKNAPLRENIVNAAGETSLHRNSNVTDRRIHPTKVLAEEKRQYHRRKIQLKRKRKKEKRRKQYLKWKKEQRRKKRRKKEKERRRMRKKMAKRQRKQNHMHFKYKNGKTSDGCSSNEDDVSVLSSTDYSSSISATSSSMYTSSNTDSDMPISSDTDDDNIILQHKNHNDIKSITSLKQLKKMKTEINKIVNENVNNKMKRKHNRAKIGIKSPKGAFKNKQTKKSPLSENLHKSVNTARRRKHHRRQSDISKVKPTRGLKNLNKPLPPMHSPPSSVNKINIIPSRPRLPDLDSLQKRNKAEDVLFDAAIDRYRSTSLTASLSLPQSTRPRNSQVCGLKGVLLSSPSMKGTHVGALSSNVHETPRTIIKKQRKLQRHTLPGLKAIEEIRKKLSPISTPTHKWGFVLNSQLEKKDDSTSNNGLSPTKRRQRSSTLNQVLCTPKHTVNEVNKMQSPVQLKPIQTKTKTVIQSTRKDTMFLPPKKDKNNVPSIDSSNNNDSRDSSMKDENKKIEDTGNDQVKNESVVTGDVARKKQKKKKKMNSNQLQFVKSLSKKKPQPPVLANMDNMPTYKKKAPAPLLTFNLIRNQSIHEVGDTDVNMETGITLNTNGSFVSNFSNGSPSIWL